MGKNKGGGKKPAVFKVAGAKSFKVKSKAKPVTGNLKKINEIVRKNIDKIDQNVMSLESDLRQKKEDKMKSNSNQNKKPKEFQGAADFEKEKQKTCEKLSEMQF